MAGNRTSAAIAALPLHTAPGAANFEDSLLMTDDGWILGATGVDLVLSGAFRHVLGKKKAPRKYVRWLRRFLAFRFREGEGPRAFLTETFEEAVARCVAFLRSIGCVVDPGENRLDGGFDVSHPTAMRYLRTAVSTIRQLYVKLCDGIRTDPANPMEVNGWHKATAPEKLQWALAHQMKPEHGLKHAGGRFHVKGVKSSPPAIEDPSACAPQMTQALIDAKVPTTILDIAMVMQDNGARNSSAAEGNALGWAMADFGDEFWSVKKWGGDDLCLLLALPDEVLARIKERFDKAPHPHPFRHNSSMLDHLRELWEDGSKEAKAELATYALFPSKLGTKYTYDGFYYHFSDAIDGRVLIRTDTASRAPTSQWYRHAAISSDIRDLFERTTIKAERKAGLDAIMDAFGLSTDQTRQYAAFEYVRDGRRRQREAVRKRRERGATKRAASPAPIGTGYLSMPEAQAAHDALPRRKKK